MRPFFTFVLLLISIEINKYYPFHKKTFNYLILKLIPPLIIVNTIFNLEHLSYQMLQLIYCPGLLKDFLKNCRY